MTWKQILILRRRFERIHKGKIYKALMDQLNDVLHEVNVGVLDVLPEKIKTIVSDKSVRKAFYSLYDDVGWEFYRAFKVKKSSEDLERSLWDQTFEAVIESETGMRITLITDYSKEILMNTAKEALRIGQEQGLGVQDMERLMREMLKSEFQQMARYRSLRIIQTEVMSASNFATLKAGENSGIQMMKVWLTAPVGTSKIERHAVIDGLNGQQRTKGQDFNVGGVPMGYPGDPKGGVENIVNCKCALSWLPVDNTINV